MFGRDRRKQGQRCKEVNAFLGEGTNFEGKLSFEGVVRLDGKFKGEISAQDTLVVGESGQVDAQISADVVIISGTIRGNIEAKTRVEIRPPGALYGDVKTNTLIISAGAILNGHCTMSDERKASDLQMLTLVGKKGDLPKEAEDRLSGIGPGPGVPRA